MRHDTEMRGVRSLNSGVTGVVISILVIGNVTEQSELLSKGA